MSELRFVDGEMRRVGYFEHRTTTKPGFPMQLMSRFDRDCLRGLAGIFTLITHPQWLCTLLAAGAVLAALFCGFARGLVYLCT